MRRQAIAVLLGALTAIGIAWAGSNGVGTGGLAGPSGGASVNGSDISPGSVTTPFVDAGTEYLHGPLTLDGLITGCRITPSVDSNFLYFQGCAMRSAAGLRSDANITIGGAGLGLKLTDDTTYSTLVDLTTKPTVTACSGGTAASVTMAAGTATVVFDVGTSCAGESTAVLTFPASANGWLCSCSSTTADRVLQQKVIPPASTTQVTIQNIVMSTGANGDFTDGADVGCICRGI